MAVITTIDQQNNKASFEFWTAGINTSTLKLNALTSKISQNVLVNPITVPYGEHVDNIKTIKVWKNDVESLFSLNHSVDNKNRQVYDKDNNILTGSFKIGNFNYSKYYDNSTKNIIINPHDAHTYTWGLFIFYLLFHSYFNDEVLRNYS